MVGDAICGFILPAMVLVLGAPGSSLQSGEPARVQAQPGSNSKSRPEVVWPGLTHAGTVLLPNGWSLKPAGRQTRLGDFPVQMAVHPSE
ncbi:MAG TPA: hypothetical protein VJY33_19050, partial [Isosphaeraceae bacterium]|nr:hypothetical protein [Isosphaeraceae bacterium]